MSSTCTIGGTEEVQKCIFAILHDFSCLGKSHLLIYTDIEDLQILFIYNLWFLGNIWKFENFTFHWIVLMLFSQESVSCYFNCEVAPVKLYSLFQGIGRILHVLLTCYITNSTMTTTTRRYKSWHQLNYEILNFNTQ